MLSATSNIGLEYFTKLLNLFQFQYRLILSVPQEEGAVTSVIYKIFYQLILKTVSSSGPKNKTRV